MKRKLGRDGPQLFPIGLGCMGMSEAYGERAERDESESIATSNCLACRAKKCSQLL